MSRSEACESREVVIRSDPLATVLDGESRKVRVSDEIPFHAGGHAELGENIPMTLPGSYEHRVWL